MTQSGSAPAGAQAAGAFAADYLIIGGASLAYWLAPAGPAVHAVIRTQ